MNLVPWKRTRTLADNDFCTPFFAPASRLFRDFFDEDFFALDRPLQFSPALDVEEDENAYRVTAELPGIDPKDVNITLESDVLTLRGVKMEEKSEKKDKNNHWTERRYGSFVRSLSLPVEVDGEKVSANYKNGVLEITLPKAEVSKPKQISVNVEK